VAGAEQSNNPDLLLEVTRRDGGDVDPEELLDALRSHRPWRNLPWGLPDRPDVSDDGTVRIVGIQFEILPRPPGTVDRVLFAAAPADTAWSWLSLLVKSLKHSLRMRVVGAAKYKFRKVCGVRGFSRCGRIPVEITRFALPYLSVKLRNPVLVRDFGWLLFASSQLGYFVLIPWTTGSAISPITWYREIRTALESDDYSGVFFSIFWTVILLAFVCSVVYAAVSIWIVASSQRRIAGAGVLLFNRVHRRSCENICWSAVAARVCHACGYDLRESDNERCPECGHPNLRWWCERGRLAEAVTALPGVGES
jgi:hypothetical protein